MNTAFIIFWILIASAGVVCTTQLALSNANLKAEADRWRRSAEQNLISFGNRERELMSELNASKLDANRLAGIVARLIADVEATAALLKDDAPPEMAEEREALAIHRTLSK